MMSARYNKVISRTTVMAYAQSQLQLAYVQEGARTDENGNDSRFTRDLLEEEPILQFFTLLAQIIGIMIQLLTVYLLCGMGKLGLFPDDGTNGLLNMCQTVPSSTGGGRGSGYAGLFLWTYNLFLLPGLWVVLMMCAYHVSSRFFSDYIRQYPLEKSYDDEVDLQRSTEQAQRIYGTGKWMFIYTLQIYVVYSAFMMVFNGDNVTKSYNTLNGTMGLNWENVLIVGQLIVSFIILYYRSYFWQLGQDQLGSLGSQLQPQAQEGIELQDIQQGQETHEGQEAKGAHRFIRQSSQE